MKRLALLVVPALSAVLALQTGYVLYKLGVPGCCGLILWFAMRSVPAESRRPLWALIGAFGMSMVGDWFLSNRSK